MKTNSFDFSVIMPIYNTADYLDEAISSVISQTIGFKEHIQLVLINDGSTDNSEEICLRYKEQYPENIIYYYKQNGGVASAKNAGLKLAGGKYLNFMSSDDYWSKNSFEELKSFFDCHYDDIDIVTCKVRLFGKTEKDHILNFRFKSNAVIDLDEKPEYMQCADGTCFIKQTVAKKHIYEERLGNAEDALFINSILIDKCKIGVLKNALYYYRKREDSITSNRTNRKRFTVEPELFQKALYRLSEEKYGYIKPFIAYTVMYEMQWRFSEIPPEDVTAAELKDYTDTQRELLQEIDDKTIFSQKSLSVTKKLYVYKLKYRDAFEDGLEFKGRFVYKSGVKIFDIAARAQCQIRNMHVNDSMLVIEGLIFTGVLGFPYELYLKRKGKKPLKAMIERDHDFDIISFNGEAMWEGETFRFEIPVEEKDVYSFAVRINDGNDIGLNPMFNIFSKCNDKLENNYWFEGDYLFKWFKQSLHVYRYGLTTHIACEKRLVKELRKRGEDSICSMRKGVLGQRKKNKLKRIIIYAGKEYEDGAAEKYAEYINDFACATECPVSIIDADRLEKEKDKCIQDYLDADLIFACCNHSKINQQINPLGEKEQFIRDHIKGKIICLEPENPFELNVSRIESSLTQ